MLEEHNLSAMATWDMVRDELEKDPRCKLLGKKERESAFGRYVILGPAGPSHRHAYTQATLPSCILFLRMLGPSFLNARMASATVARATDVKKTREGYTQLLVEAEVVPETTWAKVGGAPDPHAF